MRVNKTTFNLFNMYENILQKTDLTPTQAEIMDYLLQTPGTAGLQTTTYRNWWRPAGDAQSASVPQADPIFVATARKREAPDVSQTDL